MQRLTAVRVAVDRDSHKPEAQAKERSRATPVFAGASGLCFVYGIETSDNSITATV